MARSDFFKASYIFFHLYLQYNINDPVIAILTIGIYHFIVTFLRSLSTKLCFITGASCLIPFLIHPAHQLGLIILSLIVLIATHTTLKHSLGYCLWGVIILYAHTYQTSHHLYPHGPFNQEVSVIEPQFSKDQNRILVRGKHNLKWQLYLRKNQTRQQLNYGDRLRISGQIKKSTPATNPGQFDTQRWLYLKGISGQITPKKNHLYPSSKSMGFKTTPICY